MQPPGFWETLARSLTGPGRLRLILQPALAMVLGVRLGLADAKRAERPFVLRLLTARAERGALFKESLARVVVPFCLAVAIDAALQLWTLGRIRPLAALVVGALLVWLPFLAARALTNRLWRRSHRRTPRQGS